MGFISKVAFFSFIDIFVGCLLNSGNIFQVDVFCGYFWNMI